MAQLPRPQQNTPQVKECCATVYSVYGVDIAKKCGHQHSLVYVDVHASPPLASPLNSSFLPCLYCMLRAVLISPVEIDAVKSEAERCRGSSVLHACNSKVSQLVLLRVQRK